MHLLACASTFLTLCLSSLSDVAWRRLALSSIVWRARHDHLDPRSALYSRGCCRCGADRGCSTPPPMTSGLLEHPRSCPMHSHPASETGWQPKREQCPTQEWVDAGRGTGVSDSALACPSTSLSCSDSLNWLHATTNCLTSLAPISTTCHTRWTIAHVLELRLVPKAREALPSRATDR
eukprot:6476049-Amphidinium_carterae.2